MGRKAEPGIRYYRMECNHIRNPKVRLLINDFGPKGYWVWQCILASAYEGKGYYFDYSNKDALELFAAEVCRERVSVVEEIITGCIRRLLFDKEVADRFRVLSSAEMQEVYLDATAERRRKGTTVEINTDYLLLPTDDLETKRWENVQFIGEKIIVPRNKTINPRNKTIDPQQNPQSKVKYNIEKETIGKNPVSPPVPPAVVSQIPVINFQKEYQGLDKTKDNIFHFIRDNKPDFIEPYVDFWNIFAGIHSLPKVSTISRKRRQHFAVRVREPAFNFPEILRKAKGSEFLLTGNWFGFDWLIKNDSNYVKLLEGNYEKKTVNNEQQSGSAQTPNSERERIIANTKRRAAGANDSVRVHSSAE